MKPCEFQSSLALRKKTCSPVISHSGHEQNSSRCTITSIPRPLSLTHLFQPAAALNIHTTCNYLFYNAVFFPYHLFYTLISYGPTQPKLCQLHKMLMHSSETEDAIPVRNVPLSLESMDLSSCLLRTWESAKCLKTAARQIKTSVG